MGFWHWYFRRFGTEEQKELYMEGRNLTGQLKKLGQTTRVAQKDLISVIDKIEAYMKKTEAYLYKEEQ